MSWSSEEGKAPLEEEEEEEEGGEEGPAPLEEEEEEEGPAPRCAGCRHLRQKCLPECPFAPYFPPDDADRFAEMADVFDPSNVADLLADLPPEQRADAVESLVYSAQARLREPVHGSISYIALLHTMLEHVRGEVAAKQEQLAQLVGRDAAFQPLDLAAAPPAARQVAEANFAATLRFVREQDDALRADMQAQAAGKAAKQTQNQPTNAQQISDAAELAMQQLLDASYANNDMAGSGSGSGATIMPFQQPTGRANTDAFLAQRQLQLQPPRHMVNVQFQEESPSLLPLPAWLAGLQPRQQQSFRPGGPANDEAFLFQEQPQPPQTVNVPVQEQPSLRSWSGLEPPQQQTFLPGGWSGSANSQAFLAQQQQRLNVLGSQVEPSLPPLPPSLADSLRQQQDDGGNEGQSFVAARYWNHFPLPRLPPGGRC